MIHIDKVTARGSRIHTVNVAKHWTPQFIDNALDLAGFQTAWWFYYLVVKSDYIVASLWTE